MQVCIYGYVHIYVYVCIYICIHVYVDMYTCIYIYTYIIHVQDEEGHQFPTKQPRAKQIYDRDFSALERFVVFSQRIWE